MSKKVDEAYERGYDDGRQEASRDVERLRVRCFNLLRTDSISGITSPAAAASLLAYLEDAVYAASDDLDWSTLGDE